MMAIFLAVVTQSKEVGLLCSRDVRLLERAHPIINYCNQRIAAALLSPHLSASPVCSH